LSWHRTFYGVSKAAVLLSDFGVCASELVLGVALPLTCGVGGSAVLTTRPLPRRLEGVAGPLVSSSSSSANAYISSSSTSAWVRFDGVLCALVATLFRLADIMDFDTYTTASQKSHESEAEVSKICHVEIWKVQLAC
jgi:hypothetical protein